MSLDSILSQYSISPSTGFVPGGFAINDSSGPSSLRLWLSAARSIPVSLSTGSFRSVVHDIPLLSVPSTTSAEDLREAYVCLSYIAQAYLWEAASKNKKSQPILGSKDHIPASIAIPLQEIAERIDIPPYLTFAALVLWNRQSALTPQALISFTSLPEESIYINTLVEVEHAGGKALVHALEASRAAGPRGDVETVRRALAGVHDALHESVNKLNSLKDRNDLIPFMEHFRPFLLGTEALRSTFPDGVLCESVVDDTAVGEWRKIPRVHVAQSSFAYGLDIILGVRHEPNSAEEEFIEESQEAMPGDHARFLSDIDSLPSLAAFIRNAEPGRTTTTHQHGGEHDAHHDHNHDHDHDLPHPHPHVPAPPDTSIVLPVYIAALRSLIDFRTAQINHIDHFFSSEHSSASPNLPAGSQTDEGVTRRLVGSLRAMRCNSEKAVDRVAGRVS